MRSLFLLVAWFVTSLVSAQDIVLPPEPGFVSRVVTKDDVAAAKAAKTSVLRQLFGGRAALVARFNRIDPRFVRAGTSLKVPRAFRAYQPMPATWPPAATLPKAIVIALDLQFLATYEFGALTASYPISSGRPGFETPEGRYSVTKKDETHVSSKYPEETEGGWPMPHALRFKGSEFWVHGGDLKGFPDSHGCVRLMHADAKKVFAWADLGTPVRVIAMIRTP